MSNRPKTRYLVGAAIAAWLGLELIAALTLISLEPHESEDAAPDDRDWVRQTRLSFDGGLYREDARCFWRLSPGYRGRHGDTRFWGDTPLTINEHGMRSPPVAIKRPTTTQRILVVGGSHPMGMYVNAAQAYSAQLEARLNEKNAGAWQVLNAAVPGYTSFQGRQYLLHYAARFEPQIVIFDLGANDRLPLTAEFPLPDHRVTIPDSWTSGLRNALEMSPVFRLMRLWLTPGWAPSGVRVPDPEHTNNVQAVIDWGRTHQIHILFMGQARFDLHGSQKLQCLHSERNLKDSVDICALWEAMGPGAAQYFADPIHANAAGHALIANEVHKRLRALKWVD
jgi:lysophospholipase L1-like esterase